MLEQPFEVFFEVWVFEHQQTWSKYKDDPRNRTTIIAAAKQYPLLPYATFDRALFDSKNQLVRTDGHDEDWDREQEDRNMASIPAYLFVICGSQAKRSVCDGIPNSL